MIDSFNQTITDNTTLSQNQNQNQESDSSISLIEIILSEVPFLALGFLGLTIITFYSTFNRSNKRILLLEISSLTACFASLLNLIGMFYNQDQVAFFDFQDIQEDSLRRFILGMLGVKQVLLAVSTGTMLLYFHMSLEKMRKSQTPFPNNTIESGVGGGIRNEKRPKSFTEMIQERNRTYCDAMDGRDSQCILGKLARLSIVLTIFTVFVLDLTWRIGFLFDLSQASLYRRINIAGFSLQLILYLIYSSCPIHHLLQTSPSFRKNVLRQYGGLIGGISLGVVVVIGSLASLGFSERVVGRLFQGVQLYVLITSQLILDFTPIVNNQSNAGSITHDQNVKDQYNSQEAFEVLSIPDASTFRVTPPPSISTPSPHPIQSGGKRVSFIPTFTSRRPFSGSHDHGLPRNIDRRSRTSVSSRIKTWVLSGHPSHSLPLYEREVEGRFLTVPSIQRSSSSTNQEGTYKTQQNTFGRGPTPPPKSRNRSSGSMEPARRSSQTIFNTLTRFSQGQFDGIQDLIGIRRTTPSPGARKLVLGSESGDVEGLPSSGDQSRGSGGSGLLDMPLNFPRPPSRSTSLPGAGVRDPLDFESMNVDDLPLPNRLFVKEQGVDMKNKGHGRMRSDMTHINVTSFIEGGSSRIDSMSSTHPSNRNHYENISSLIQPSNWMRKAYQSELSQVPSATLTLSSEAPTEIYLPIPPSKALSPTTSRSGSGTASEETTPTYSIHDVREAKISRVLMRSNSQPILSTNSSSSSIPITFENDTLPPRRRRSDNSDSNLPMPESPTLPSSANSFGNSNGQVKMVRAATTGQEWYKKKYGVI
ncbi:uncharacterized protein L199_001172 [Kwoniella botswanensis]|uniref:uncharacterized protein n=1 Tax=Kwoniella botswanensis TaxID=1268659 RepID=UPI00315DDD60